MQNGVHVSGDTIRGCIGLAGASAAQMSTCYGFVCVDPADEGTCTLARCLQKSLGRYAEVIRPDGRRVADSLMLVVSTAPCGILETAPLENVMTSTRMAFLDIDGTILDHGKAIAASTVAAIRDAPELLHVHLHQFPRPVPFVAHRGGLRGSDQCSGDPVRLAQTGHVVAAQGPPHRPGSHTEFCPDPVLAPPSRGAQGEDLSLDLVAGAGRGGVRTGRPVVQSGFAFVLVAGDPVGHALAGQPHRSGDVGRRHATPTRRLSSRQRATATHVMPGCERAAGVNRALA